MAITDLGDILGGIGDVKPETVNLLHARERMGLEASRQKAIDDYYKSLIGQSSARMMLEQARLRLAEKKANEPVYIGPGTFAAPGVPGGPATQVTPFAPERAGRPFFDKDTQGNPVLVYPSPDPKSPPTIIPVPGLAREQDKPSSPPRGYRWKEGSEGKEVEPLPGYVDPGRAPTDFGTFYNAQKAAGKTDAQISELWHKQKVAEAGAAGRERALAYGMGRFGVFLDTANGNAPVSLSFGEAREANRTEPGRYLPASEGVRALQRTAIVEEVTGALGDVRAALDKMPEFNASQAAQLALVMKDRDSRSAFSEFMGSRWASTLSNEQVDYVTSLVSLKESSFALRNILGLGQGSDLMRAAIGALVPSAMTPTKAYAKRQLDVLEAELKRVARAIPTVQLPTQIGTPTPTGKPSVVSPQSQGMRPGDKAPEGVADGEYTVRGQRVRVKNGIIQ